MAAALSDRQVLKIIRAAVLLGAAGEALSPFEADLVQEVAERFRAFGRQTVVSQAEWEVLEAATSAMSPPRRAAA